MSWLSKVKPWVTFIAAVLAIFATIGSSFWGYHSFITEARASAIEGLEKKIDNRYSQIQVLLMRRDVKDLEQRKDDLEDEIHVLTIKSNAEGLDAIDRANLERARERLIDIRREIRDKKAELSSIVNESQ